jgi:hypothetical protein
LRIGKSVLDEKKVSGSTGPTRKIRGKRAARIAVAGVHKIRGQDECLLRDVEDEVGGE